MDNIKKFEDFLDRMQGLLDNAKKQGHIIVRVEDLEKTFPELREEESKEKPNGGIVMEDFNEGNGFYKVNLNYLNKEQVEEIEELVKKWNPELKESEDEKIRNGIIKYLSYIKDRDGSYMPNNIPFDDMIAWLEKQGEQKVGCTTLVETITIPESKIVVNENKEWNEEDNKWIESLIQTFEDEYLEGFNQLKSYGVINWLKSLKERINEKQ